MEADVPTALLAIKTKIMIGTWNIKTLHETGENAQVPFDSKGRGDTVIECYAPTNEAENEEKVNFYEHVPAVIDKWKSCWEI
ncbi:hypothetical protein EGW08_009874 [Elysia chlorotica]|uniref:Endonuclease/exonuclease/phosphatase domain-containing protein n=1 Tax=Elysia chlorotica TaxID=188477 RepID=A0A3S1BF81_ELYCH|nr:hypothetical protein EGW08_009874 [Elysia chlorotica]